jgi:polysaccharide biosynthesis protein VpsQ
MKTKTISKYLPPIVFLTFIIWIIILADMNKTNLIMDIGHAIPWGDKIGHFSLFGIMALLLNIAIEFKQIKVSVRRFHLGSVIVFSFAVLEEFTQLLFSTRTFDLVDMLFDLLGIGLLSSVAFRRFVVGRLQLLTNYLAKNLLIELQD